MWLFTCIVSFFFFFFNDTATTEIYTLSLHDALPISQLEDGLLLFTLDVLARPVQQVLVLLARLRQQDRKSTRLNSSHGYISYAVFCLKKKKKTPKINTETLTHYTLCISRIIPIAHVC